MESIIIIYFCLLLLTFVSNGVGEHSLVGILNKMAYEGDSINELLKPLQDGFLGKLPTSVTYKGVLLPKNKEVSMKFRDFHLGHNEFDMYTYLDAIIKPNKRDVAVYGIPSIYYYGKWKKYTVMAMTLFSPEFHKCRCSNNYNQIDVMIMFREYVRIRKYMHSRGLFQEHMFNLLNTIMFREDKGFVYEFTGATRLSDPNREAKLSAAQKDWKLFLREIFLFIDRKRLHHSWFGFERITDSEVFALNLLADSATHEPHNGLKRVFIEFTKRAYCKDKMNGTSFYDQLYELIVKELGKTDAALPSWLSRADRCAVKAAPNTISSISNIPDPFTSDAPLYEEVNYRYFVGYYRDYLIEIHDEAYRREFGPDRASSSGADEKADPENSYFNFGNIFQWK